MVAGIIPRAIAYNSDLALYDPKDAKAGHLDEQECLPESLEVGQEYSFLKKGHRNYQPMSELTLLEMRHGDVLFTFKARVVLLSSQFIQKAGVSYTQGRYQVLEILAG